MTAIRTLSAVKAELREIGARIDAAVQADEPTLAIAMLVRTRYELADEYRAVKAALPDTFSALIVRIARQHETLVDQLHAAADALGISHKEADALLVQEIEAGPVEH